MAYSDLHDTDHVIKFKTGLDANINATATVNSATEGEPHYATDTKELYIFDGSANVGLDSRYVNVTGDTMTGQLLIDLGSDTEGLVIQGDVGQTANFLEVQDSDSNVIISSNPYINNNQVFLVDVTNKGDARSIPAMFLYSYSSTDLTSSIGSGGVYRNTDKTAGNYSSLQFSSLRSDDVALPFGHIACVFTDHTTGDVKSDFAFIHRIDNSLTETFRLSGATQTGLLTVPTSTLKGLVVKGAASQTANLQEWQDSNANVLAEIGPTGVMGIGTTSNPLIGQTLAITNTDPASTSGGEASRSDGQL